jgi:(4S)-4-hydroxy-5-phosphonooxypentane-2,3-dione isomerase
VGNQKEDMALTVKPELVAKFCWATPENARSSVHEPEIACFDVAQERDDATRFVLIEVYRSREAAAAHKETWHYAKWRDVVANMMADTCSPTPYRCHAYSLPSLQT